MVYTYVCKKCGQYFESLTKDGLKAQKKLHKTCQWVKTRYLNDKGTSYQFYVREELLSHVKELYLQKLENVPIKTSL